MGLAIDASGHSMRMMNPDQRKSTCELGTAAYLRPSRVLHRSLDTAGCALLLVICESSFPCHRAFGTITSLLITSAGELRDRTRDTETTGFSGRRLAGRPRRT